MASDKRRSDRGAQLPSERVFTGRTTETVGGTPETSYKTKPPTVTTASFTSPHGEFGLSSYPHLTEIQTQQGKTSSTVKHVTDVRLLTTMNAHGKDFKVFERYHQDDKVGAKFEHDRFLATAPDGTVHSATSVLDPMQHQPKGAKTPMRGDDLFDKTRLKTHLAFNIEEAPDDKHPPLSPRTQRRTLDQQ
ncbi:hypothetical protein GCM10007860_21300 [Chitiniphilus shinanonensis]|uniref:Uncharacterized protein n=1 Tax=Chitiniphilus shinanonensis TaxID=553088 RepID=A0ABQ6BUH1_9NEIS|nr:hypothetical protein [Chitiniphilus shinanonensis]GLS04981.1 hypothetical protein GCM10007860_21300 [Chitiniphilus shinanonensis]